MSPIFMPKGAYMREAIKTLNKASLALETGISYNRLRKFSARIVSN